MKKIGFFIILAFCLLISCKKDDDSSSHSYYIFPENSIHGIFSLPDGTKICFAQGNVDCIPYFDGWTFSENQYDYIGLDNENIGRYCKNYLDLFGFGTGKKPYLATTAVADYVNFYDWGFNYQPYSEWFTLSYDEWQYLLFQRPTASGAHFVKAVVADVKGLLLFPDDFDMTVFSFSGIDEPAAGYTSNRVSKTVFKSQLESQGAVFLPAAGLRDKTYVSQHNVKGYYWSSTMNLETEAMTLTFTSDDMSLKPMKRFYGCAVRLVAEAKKSSQR